jgi:hypothetical protein
MSFTIRTGVWTDWSRGSVLGATLTLSPRDGALLLAFIAAFVTAVSSQLWRIIGFAAHQLRARPGPHDGLHFQTQIVLRNASSPFGAAWLFLQQSWSWRRRVPGSLTRTLGWAVFATLYLILFTVLAIFSSQVSKAACEIRLIQGLQCGYWEVSKNASIDTSFALGARAVANKVAFDTATASRYARACYAANKTSPECGILPAASLPWKGYNESECPFSDLSTCAGGQAIRMITGPIDSHAHLGINTPPEHRITLSRNASCAPMPVESFATYESLSGNDSTADTEYGRWSYDFGVVVSASTNYTFRYNTAAQSFGFGYTVIAYENQAGQAENNTWFPVPALQAQNADISIYFILFNSVHFLEPNDDPVFTVSTRADENTYSADRPVSVISCVEQHQVCNPVNGRCSPFHGRRQMMVHSDTSPTNLILDLNLNVQQIAVLERTDWALMQSGIADAVSLSEVGNLRAENTLLSGPIQLGLPSNQWQLEVTGWLEESLAKFQHLIQEYATGPTIDIEGSNLFQVWVPEKGEPVTDDKALRVLRQTEKEHCSSQITRDTQGTLSFSVLGLAIIFATGGLIIILSLTIVPIVAWLQARFIFGEYKRRTWIMDEMLQLQRMLLSELGLGVWSGPTGLVPVTLTQDKIEFGAHRAAEVDEHAVAESVSANQKK